MSNPEIWIHFGVLCLALLGYLAGLIRYEIAVVLHLGLIAAVLLVIELEVGDG